MPPGSSASLNRQHLRPRYLASSRRPHPHALQAHPRPRFRSLLLWSAQVGWGFYAAASEAVAAGVAAGYTIPQEIVRRRRSLICEHGVLVVCLLRFEAVGAQRYNNRPQFETNVQCEIGRPVRRLWTRHCCNALLRCTVAKYDTRVPILPGSVCIRHVNASSCGVVLQRSMAKCIHIQLRSANGAWHKCDVPQAKQPRGSLVCTVLCCDGVRPPCQVLAALVKGNRLVAV